MPELPEVETVRRGIAPHVVGRTITRVVVREPRLRWPIPRGFARAVAGRRIEAAERRGKYLLLRTVAGTVLLHLGMSGRLGLHPIGTPAAKHDHLDLELDNQWMLRLRDPRRFGAALWWPADEPSHPLLDELGPEPLSTDFSPEYLFRRSRGRRVAIKNFLMNGRIVVGAGNIYATEALFRAGIRPTRPAGRLRREQCERLVAELRVVLNEALKAGGTTLRDYRTHEGAPGFFFQALQVYGRAGSPCPVCATTIRGLVIGQRSSFYCPTCQR